MTNAQFPITVIVTVLNEAKTIKALLTALTQQTLLPKQVIIVDAGSQDETVKLIKQFQKNQSCLKIKLIVKPSNRSQGRNLAVKKSQTSWIAITDAGCIPQKSWLAELAKTQQQNQAPVVAGFYQGQAQTAFEQAVIPYVLVMPDRVEPAKFLPATRSMLIKKSVWQSLGGLNEQLNFAEDHHFARKLQKQSVPIAFSRRAIVSWLPRKNLTQFSKMIFQLAQGDAMAGNWRPKVGLVFLRYLLIFGLLLVLWTINWPREQFLALFTLLGLIYLGWAIAKNQRYAPQGWYWLPVLQVSADLAVMAGTLTGWLKINLKMIK
ncbi:MAG: glycosyltransferase [Candidatus Pacebacteria bacterium]|nr:glycosyltransferase [Candidatus Paceibacterota bacterium]